MHNAKPKESVRALLAEIVDYAGLFPPSQLPMSEAVANYAAYQTSDYKWMLGRFVVPVSRLGEFAASAKQFFSDDREAWRLSVLASEDIGEIVGQIKDFNREFAANAVCDALEIKADSSERIKAVVEVVPPDLDVFFELPLTQDFARIGYDAGDKKQSAKIRAGGVTEDAFPPVENITRFMRICLAANVPFKATAGLHHPLRCVKPLTYESNAPTGRMNGFLNVFLAAAFIQQGIETRLIHELLRDDRADSFLFTGDGVLWRQEYFIGTAHLKFLRQRCAISFGSCSFVEPIEDLQEIGLL